MTIKEKHTGLLVSLHINVDAQSIGDAPALGACIQSLTGEGWHLSQFTERENGALTAVLYRNWEVGIPYRPVCPPMQVGDDVAGGYYREGVAQPDTGRQDTPPTASEASKGEDELPPGYVWGYFTPKMPSIARRDPSPDRA